MWGSAAMNVQMTSDRQIVKDEEGNYCSMTYGAVLAFAWKEWIKI